MWQFLLGSSFFFGSGIFFLALISIKQINAYEKGLIFTMGKFTGIAESGWRIVIPIFQSMRIVDIRTKTVDLQDQEGMTSDNVSVKIGAVVFYSVSNAAKSILEVENYRFSVSQLAETTIRTVVGEITLQELLTKRDHIAEQIEHIIQPKTEVWGVQIESVELKDIVLPDNMKRTMAKQAEAEREKLAVITKAEGELKASGNLAKAAKTLSATPGALHLRTLSTLNDLSSDQSNTIIFAIPIEVLRAYEGKGAKDTSGDIITKVIDAIKK